MYGAGQNLYPYQDQVRVISQRYTQIITNPNQYEGGLPGFAAVISRAPQDGSGVTNWDDASLLTDMIKYHVYGKALGLPHVDWGSRYVATKHHTT